MKKPQPIKYPDCNLCEKSGYVIVNNVKGERVARKCVCRLEKPPQDDFNSFVGEAVNKF